MNDAVQEPVAPSATTTPRESLARASLLSFLSGNVTLIVGLALNVFVARSLGPTTKGLYSVFLNTQGILMVPSFAIETSLFYTIARRRPARSSLNRFVLRTAFVQAALSIILLTALVQFSGVRRLLFPGLSNLFLLVLGISLFLAFWERYRGTFLPGAQLYGRFAIVGAAASTISSVCVGTLLLVAWLSHQRVSVGSIILATSLGILVSAGVWWRASARIPVGGDESDDEGAAAIGRDVRSFGVPVFLRSLLEWVSYRVDVYIVNVLAGAHALGIYTVGVGAAQQLWVVPFAIGNPLFNRIAHDGDTPESRETTRYAFKLCTVISLGLCVMAGIAVPLLLPLVYGSAFAAAVSVLLIFLPGTAAAGATRAFNSYFLGANRNIEIVKAELIAIAVTVSLDFRLVPMYGARGAALAASCAYLCSSFALAYRFTTLSGSRAIDLVYFNPHDRERLRQSWTRLVAQLPGARPSAS